MLLMMRYKTKVTKAKVLVQAQNLTQLQAQNQALVYALIQAQAALVEAQLALVRVQAQIQILTKVQMHDKRINTNEDI